ncbi:uncharacterized protein LOC118768273 [Octopus sinensis]|uniref:Uncharacterized protein LOC118768273 n=1 Tax=Octopus sinensis TaxID=2607531 RepID=A0A7E6FTY5_9MOLL|nr:uncharacterized protein LOC118768273 [Octopus sinensis]
MVNSSARNTALPPPLPCYTTKTSCTTPPLPPPHCTALCHDHHQFHSREAPPHTTTNPPQISAAVAVLEAQSSFKMAARNVRAGQQQLPSTSFDPAEKLQQSNTLKDYV